MKSKKIIIIMAGIAAVCIMSGILGTRWYRDHKKPVAPFTSINLNMGQKELMRMEPGLKVMEGYTDYLETQKEYDGYAGTLGVSPKNFIEWDSTETEHTDTQIYYSYTDLLDYLEEQFGDSYSMNTWDPVLSYDRGENISCIWDLKSTIVNCSLYQKDGKEGGVTIHFVIKKAVP